VHTGRARAWGSEACNRIAVGVSSGRVALFDAAALVRLWDAPVAEMPVGSVAFLGTRAGPAIACGSPDGVVAVLRLAGRGRARGCGALARKIPTHPHTIVHTTRTHHTHACMPTCTHTRTHTHAHKRTHAWAHTHIRKRERRQTRARACAGRATMVTLLLLLLALLVVLAAVWLGQQQQQP
jgi:hypothetical protein